MVLLTPRLSIVVLGRTGDSAASAVTLYSMNGSSATFFTFWGILLYPATDAATVSTI